MSLILNVASDGATITGFAAAFTVISAKTQFLDQVKINSTSESACCFPVVFTVFK